MLNYKIYLTDVLGETVANIYETYTYKTPAYNYLYNQTYAYGSQSDVERVHQMQLSEVASMLGYDVQDVHEAYEEAIKTILNYWEIPEEFRDKERYESD